MKEGDVSLHHRAPRNRVRYCTVHDHTRRLPPRAPRHVYRASRFPLVSNLGHLVVLSYTLEDSTGSLVVLSFALQY